MSYSKKQSPIKQLMAAKTHNKLYALLLTEGTLWCI